MFKNILFMFLSLPKKQQIIIVLCIVLFVVGITVLIVRSRKKRLQREAAALEELSKQIKAATEKPVQTNQPEETGPTNSIADKDPERPGKLYLDLSASKNANIKDLAPDIRFHYGNFHDEIFEAEKWVAEMPEIPMKMGWRLTPLPAFKNAVVRFLISNSQGHRVSVLFDPYGIHCLEEGGFWWVLSKETETSVYIPYKDVKQLVDTISEVFAKAKEDSKKKV